MQAETAEKNLHKIRLTEAEITEKLLAERNASSARLQEVVGALRKNIPVLRRRRIRRRHTQQGKRLYEQARSIVSLHAVKVSDLHEKIVKLTDEVEKICSFRICQAL